MDAKQQLRVRRLKRRRKLGKIAISKQIAQSANDEAACLQRLQAISLIAGLWARRGDAPKDGLVYQEALRAEW